MPQSLGQVYVHLIFSTKGRVPWIDDEIEGKLFKKLFHTVRQSGSECKIVGGYLDHVHLLFKLHRTKSISKIVEVLKTVSCKWVKKQGPKYSEFYWQSGYAVFSVDYRTIETVVKYIENQKQHHSGMSFKEECRKFFSEFHVQYDEEYVWD